jgi:hypothetical protein
MQCFSFVVVLPFVSSRAKRLVTRQQNTPFTAYGYNGSYYPESHDDARQRGAAAAAAAANAVATSSKLDTSAAPRAIPIVAPSDCDLTQDAQ